MTKREHARAILSALMTGRTPISIADAKSAAAAHGVSSRTMQRAKPRWEVHNGPVRRVLEAP
jgi:hypothetical protein